MNSLLDKLSLQRTPLPFGANVVENGVNYRIWCPRHESIEIVVRNAQGDSRRIRTHRDEEGYQCVLDEQGRAGDEYQLVLPDGQTQVDPVSRAQKTDVRGSSIVIDPSGYVWTDQAWRRPIFRDLVIYEIHIGTFTPDGTFLSAIPRLAHLKETGITAIEIMPVADFPGQRNWGYEGVLLYAPAKAYGSPDDFRALVDAAHRTGLAVILDVVYNHAGPDGSPLAALSSGYFNPDRPTPWGQSFNLDGPDSQPVRDYFTWNAVYWMTEFHMDGLRLDATHAIIDSSPSHLLAEISDQVHALGGYVIAEDERNDVRLIEPRSRGGYAFNAVWADDFHHSVRVSQTREDHAYLQNFTGTLEETVDTLKYGWRFRGQTPLPDGTVRGTDCGYVSPCRLIHCIMNHDQVGNQAFGLRISDGIPPAAYRAISMLLCLTPYTPLLFMGQEWGATSPFLFFTDHHAELGRLVTEGRRQEFAQFPEFSDTRLSEQIPDPQSEATFTASKINWDEALMPVHTGIRKLYRDCLAIRNAVPAFRPTERSGWDVDILQPGVGFIRFDDPLTPYVLLFHLWPDQGLPEVDLSTLPLDPGLRLELVISSNGAEFGGNAAPHPPESGLYAFKDAEAVLFRGVRMPKMPA